MELDLGREEKDPNVAVEGREGEGEGEGNEGGENANENGCRQYLLELNAFPFHAVAGDDQRSGGAAGQAQAR